MRLPKGQRPSKSKVKKDDVLGEIRVGNSWPNPPVWPKPNPLVPGSSLNFSEVINK